MRQALSQTALLSDGNVQELTAHRRCSDAKHTLKHAAGLESDGASQNWQHAGAHRRCSERQNTQKHVAGLSQTALLSVGIMRELPGGTPYTKHTIP